MPLERSNGGSASFSELANRFASDKGIEMDDLEVDDLRLEFERFVDFISDQTEASESQSGISQKNWASCQNTNEEAKAKMLLDRGHEMARKPNRFVSEFKTRKHSFERIEKLANASESARAQILQEFTIVQSTNEALSAEVGRLKDQVEAARDKLQSVWDFIFRLKAEHVAELAEHVAKLAEHVAELARLKIDFPKLSAALVDLKRQANALQLQNADLKEAVDRISLALAKSKAEASARARERDEIRFQITHHLTLRVWILKRLFHL
jgi:chromosome segregation ATPase